MINEIKKISDMNCLNDEIKKLIRINELFNSNYLKTYRTTYKCISRHLNTSAHVYNVIQENGSQFCLKIQKGPSSKALDEFKYFKDFKEGTHFPKVFFSGRENDYAFYLMESFYSYQTYSHLLLKNRLGSEHIRKIMQFLNRIDLENLSSVQKKKQFKNIILFDIFKEAKKLYKTPIFSTF